MRRPEDLAEIVETDTGMTCSVLRYVNSSAVGLRSQVGSVQHAISVLGIQRTSLFLITSAIENGIQPAECTLLDLELFAHVNLERGLFAREVAGQTGANVELAFTGALLRDFLLPYLIKRSPAQYLEFRERALQNTLDLVQFEYAEDLCNHAQEAAHWLVGWEIPDELVCCVLICIIRDCQWPDIPNCAVARSPPWHSRRCCRTRSRQVPDGLASLRTWQQAVEYFNLSEICQRVDQKFRTLRPAGSGYRTVWQRCLSGVTGGLE